MRRPSALRRWGRFIRLIWLRRPLEVPLTGRFTPSSGSKPNL